MVESTVKLPGVGPVKTQYVYAAGAVAGVVVAYAYWRRSRTAVVVEPVSTANTALPDGTPPTVTDSNLDLTDTSAVPRTNAEWTSKAIEYLISVGYDATFAATTLGKYLARKSLTSQEQDVALAAIAGAGPPPEGGPYTIVPSPVPVPAPTPTPTILSAPATLIVRKAGRDTWALSWAAVPGATKYEVRAVTGHTGDAIRTVTGTSYTARAQQSGAHLAFEVRAKNATTTSTWRRTTVLGR